jgi:hypothetical protein
MFRALLAHPQDAIYKRHLLHCVRVMSVGCTRFGMELVTLHARNIPSAVSAAPTEDEQVIFETCRGP